MSEDEIYLLAAMGVIFMDKKKVKRSGLGIVSTLTLVFIVLKLLEVIRWPWIWVISPVWISAIFALIVFAIILIAGKIKKGKW